MVKVKGRSKLSESNLTRVNMLNLLGFLTGPTKTVKVRGSQSYPGSKLSGVNCMREKVLDVSDDFVV